jgi:hypothetical protein
MSRALLFLALAAPASSAGNPTSALLEEPAYGSKAPHYALVTMGSKDARHLWIVVDGETVYVDRNGDDRIRAADDSTEVDAHGARFADADGCDESGKPGRVRIRFYVERDERQRVGLRALSVHPVGEIQDFHATAGFIPLAEGAKEAPRIPVHGPLRFVLMDHWTGAFACRTLPRAGGAHEFSILVATPVLGIDGEAYVYPHLYRLQGDDLPKVMAVFEPRSVPPIRTWLCECGRRYRASLVVPPATEARGATLRVSFPGWQHGTLPDASFDLEYAAGPS